MTTEFPTVLPARTGPPEPHHHVALPKTRPIANAMFDGWGPRLACGILAIGIAAIACPTRANEIPTIEWQTVCATGVYHDAAVLDAPQAEWPAQAIALGASGDVLVEVSLGASGAPERTAVASSSGYDFLDGEALRVARVARYRPALDHCTPVASRAALRVSFTQ